MTADSPKCTECVFSQEQQLPPPNLGRVSICKRFPPVPVLVPTPQGVAMQTMFPMVAAEIFCHEFRRKAAPKLIAE